MKSINDTSLKHLKILRLIIMLAAVLSIGLTACSGYTGVNKTVTIQETRGDATDQYAFDQKNALGQTNLTLLLNDSLTIKNMSDEDQTLVSTPAGGVPDNSTVVKNGGTLTITYKRSGTWSISSKEQPEVTMTVTIQ
jgi:hypothetical protein